jgi:hypothetical protein
MGGEQIKLREERWSNYRNETIPNKFISTFILYYKEV